MPGSHSEQINQIVNLMTLLRPKSILDVGVGFGAYGLLAREFLDTANVPEKENHGYLQFTMRVDGIEVFETYKNPNYDWVYDKVHFGNALDILPNLEENYEMILLIDVLEHFTKEDGDKLLTMLVERGQNVLIATPNNIGDQGAEFGNEHETHVFQWRKRHFKAFDNVLFMYNQHSLFALICKDSSTKQHVRKSIFKKRYKQAYDFIRRPVKELIYMFK
jgi:hypothetical protein